MDRDPDDPDNLSAPPSMADSFERLLAEPADVMAAPLTPGTLVAGRYEVVERIGAGAMGMVYLAKDRDLERKIALKLHKKRAGTEQLRREALAMARLAHPNVVTVFEVGEHEGRTFVAMEYVAGTTLRSWLAATSRTPNEVLDALLSAAEGLIAAHDAKLVHRDFKPENVLIGSDGRARVSDFGLARESGPEVATPANGPGPSTGVAGTPAYMAPEQALGISVDARADQYAFCGVVWEALVGSWPRDDKPTKQPRLRRVLERGLSKDPSARYPSMRALLSALRRARSRRHLVAGSAAAGLLVIASGVGIAWPSSAQSISCDGAGIEVMALGLEVPSRVASEHPPSVVALVETRLAAYRASFMATAKTVCTAGLVDRTWSADLHRRGTTCLELRRRVVANQFALAGLTPTDVLDRVVRLTDPTTCGDASVLASQPALPTDPSIVEEMIRVRSVLETAIANSSARRLQGLEDAIAIATSSSVADHPTIAPRIDLVRAGLAREKGAHADAEAGMKKVYFAARAIDDPELALGALSGLIILLGDTNPSGDLEVWLANGAADAQRSRARAPSAAARLYVVAASANEGFGDPKRSLAWLREAFELLGDVPSRSLADALMIRASAYISDGQPTPAYADYLRAVEMFATLYGAEHVVVARIKLTTSAGMMALGRKDEAIRLATEAEAIVERDPSYNPSDLAQIKLNLGASHINAKNYAKAKQLLAEARALTLEHMGPDDMDLALIDTNVAYVANEERDFAKALQLARETMTLMERTTPKPHEDRGILLQVRFTAERGLGDLAAALASAIAAAEQFPVGDERKVQSLVDAARTANDIGQPSRALELVKTIRGLPAPSDPILLGRISLEEGRAYGGSDRAAAIKALDQARLVFTRASEATWVDEVEAARAKLR